jgi:hypothetical protein
MSVTELNPIHIECNPSLRLVDNASELDVAQSMLLTGFREVSNPHRTRTGVLFRTFDAQFNNYNHYAVQVFNPPEDLRDPKNLAVTYTTPWCTDLEGISTEVGKELALNGLSVVAISPNHPDLRHAFIDLGRRIRGRYSVLEQDAIAHHQILDFIDIEEHLNLKQVLGYGYSRGAMIGLGLLAVANHFDRSFPYSDLIDPCLCNTVKTQKLNPLEIGKYLIEEVGSLVREVKALPESELLHLAQTIHVDLCFWLQQLTTGIGLFEGEAGRFSDMISKDNVLHLTFFSNSPFNQADKWISAFKDYPNFGFSIIDGYHTSGINPGNRKNSVGRIVLANKLILEGVNANQIMSVIKPSIKS